MKQKVPKKGAQLHLQDVKKQKLYRTIPLTNPTLDTQESYVNILKPNTQLLFGSSSISIMMASKTEVGKCAMTNVELSLMFAISIFIKKNLHHYYS